MTHLPVREMVLYKHGVGYFVRGGTTDETTVALTFRSDEINDVLKSLAVFDQAEGGQVLGVHYQTPMDKHARLATSSIKLSHQGTLTDLVRDLRGRQVTMHFETHPGRLEPVSGRVIGVEEDAEQRHITLLANDGQVRVFPLYTLRHFAIEDNQSGHDLGYFLDTSMTEDDRRVVNVRLNDANHDLLVTYVAPSPTWRVSYRVVAETNADGNTGKALLQGWGLFDNRLEEDLNDVRVTLVAGQPISFIYDLYASRIPQRKTIRDEARVTGPVAFAAEAVVMDAMEAAPQAPTESYARPPSPSRKFARSAASEASQSGSLLRRIEKASAASTTQPAAEGKATGETFQYVVTTPVSVKRGESAMVPIIGAEVEYERELLYNRDKLPDHPVAALRFTNTTGLTLERGPVTLVEDSDYRGEAIVPFTKADNIVYLPYAVELGVNVKEESGTRYEHHRLEIEDEFLIEQQYVVITVTYTLENTTDKAQTVTVERVLDNTVDLYETRDPDAVTLHEKRWHVPVESRRTVEFPVSWRYIVANRHRVRNLSFQQVQHWAEKRYLDQDLFEDLSELLKTKQFIEKTQKQVEKTKAERGDIYERQEQLRANLGALNPTGKEAPLRDRVLKQLEETQDRLEAIDKEIGVGERTIAEAEKQVEEQVRQLANGVR
jgi:hypothetical protein